jgi:hypothetical protein
MGKISKFFKAAMLIARQPSLLNKVLDDADVNRAEVISKFGLGNGLPVAAYNELISSEQIVSPYCAMEGGSTPIDLALLKGLAGSFPSCTYFEIGTWRGESVANVASAAVQCYSLNLSDEDLLALGLSAAYVKLHRFFSKDLKNVSHLFGNSLSFDYSPYYKKCDLVFVDGDHHFESVRSDTVNAFKLLKDEHSMIVWHDYGNSPADIRWDVFRGILEGCPPEKRKHLYRVSNTLCAIYTTKNLNAKTLEQFSDPVRAFEITIKCKLDVRP